MRTYLQLDGAIFLGLTANRGRNGQLVPVLLRITAEPESAHERFNALPSYALLVTLTAVVDTVGSRHTRGYTQGMQVIIEEKLLKGNEEPRF